MEPFLRDTNSIATAARMFTHKNQLYRDPHIHMVVALKVYLAILKSILNVKSLYKADVTSKSVNSIDSTV